MTITDPFTETIISDPYAHAHELAVRPGRDADEVRLDATGHGRTVTIVVPAVELRAALDRAAAQESTDAELDALYDAFMAHSEDERSEEYTRTEGGEPYHERICSECGEAVWIKGEHYWAATRANGARKRHHVASAALSAARAARREGGGPMNEHEVTPARGDQESQAIRRGIAEATNHDGGAWEYGHYVERYDGPYVEGMVPRGQTADEDWTPLIYEATSAEDAEELHRMHRSDTGMGGPFRRSRVVRRAVSPWEVVS